MEAVDEVKSLILECMITTVLTVSNG
jgi:hypothetical protein